MSTDKLHKWDVVEQLKTKEDMVLYFEACLKEGDPALITAALGDIARAKGMSQVARATGISREGLYKALSGKGNPEFATVLKVVKALGLKLHFDSLKTWTCINDTKQRGKSSDRSHPISPHAQ